MTTMGEQLDELQSETEKLLALLKDREVGLMTWHQFLNVRLRTLQGLIDYAIGPAPLPTEREK